MRRYANVPSQIEKKENAENSLASASLVLVRDAFYHLFFLSRMIFIHFHLTHSFGTLLSIGLDNTQFSLPIIGKVKESP